MTLFSYRREILSALSSRQITFSPLLPEAEMLASLDGEELLAKFGPRYGMSWKIRCISPRRDPRPAPCPAFALDPLADEEEF